MIDLPRLARQCRVLKKKRMLNQAIENFIEKKVVDFKRIKNEETDWKITEYARALSDTLNVLKASSETSGFEKIKVLSWKEDYGAVIVLLSGCLDPLRAKVMIVGLDGWTFTVNNGGMHSALASDDPAIVCAGTVSFDSVDNFMQTVNDELRNVSSKKDDARHASNPDGGHQKTPGFILFKCVEVLNGMNGVKVTPQQSGFTDVSMHTGCTKRVTGKPLYVSLVKFILKFGVEPPVENAEECFVRLMTEYYLYCAWELAKGSISANQAMNYVKEASKYGVCLVDSHFWPDSKDFSAEFISIRKTLQDGLADEAASKSDQYMIHVPSLEELERLPSPEIILEEIPRSDPKHEESEAVILSNSKNNLEWIPSYDLKTLNDCDALLKDDRFSVSSPYQFSIVLVQVENFLYGLADRYLKDESDTECQIDICSETLISVVAKLSDKIIRFKSIQKSILDVELESRSALLWWLEFCLLFEIGIRKYKLLSQFAPALDYHDMEHLVLRTKTAWDCFDVICSYLERKSRDRLTKVFSGRIDQMKGTLSFADAFVVDDDNLGHFNRLLEQERLEAAARIEKRWKIIESKQLECKSLHSKISDLKEELVETQEELNHTERYLKYSDQSGTYQNPNWTSLNSKCDRLTNSISSYSQQLRNAKRAPAYLKQPLPQCDGRAKRALFFCYMPQVLRDIWESCYYAQDAIFSAEKNEFDLVGYLDYHTFYDGPYDYRDRKQSIRTPISLYCNSPPMKYGNEDVETISSREDGIWYPSEFDPLIIWKNGDPFTVKRDKAVDRFTEQISDKDLQWAVKQQGRDTPSDRGNLALSMLYKKPDDLSREQYLNFGDLRAFPLLQIYKVLNSIRNMSLPFKLSETHQLIQSVFYHIGEIYYDNGIKKLWKSGLYDDEFIYGLNKALEGSVDLLKDAPNNQEEFLLMLEIISFLSQFSPDIFVPLSDECSDIALTWADGMDDEIEEARNNCCGKNLEMVRARQHIFILYAALAYEMVPLVSEEQIKKLLCLSVRINSTWPDADKISKDITSLRNKLMGRLNLMLARLFHGRNFKASDLTDAARYIFPSRVDNQMYWKNIDGFYCFYTKNHEGYYISLNVLNGIALLNGKPPGRLSDDILKHPLYKRVFGNNHNFSTELSDNGIQKTIFATKGRYYSFKTIRDSLVVLEEERSNDKIIKLRLLDPDKIDGWGAQLPLGLKQLYSHWQSDDLNLVILRPINYLAREFFYIYINKKLFLIPQEDRHLSLPDLMQRIGLYERMLLLDKSLTQLLNVWAKFDLKEFIHLYITEKRSLKIVFMRYHLSFELKEGYLYFNSPQHKGFKVSSCQLMKDILYGFHSYIVLESESEPVKRQIIVPSHTIQQENGQVILRRDPKQVYDIISPVVYSFSSFQQHHRFHQIEAANICTRLQLASLFAATSSYVPEKWIGMTGFEMSIQLVRGCWVNRPLDSFEFQMLKALLELDNLPSGLVLIAHSVFEHSEKLRFLYPDEKDVFALDNNQYVTAINQYLLPSLPTNTRSELTEEECKSLGILRRTHDNHTPCKTNMKMMHEPMDISSLERDLFHLTTSNWNLAESDNYSEFSDTEGKEEPDSKKLPFTIPKELPFMSTEIGNHMISRLESSYQKYQSNRNSNLMGSSRQILRELRKIEKNTLSSRQKLETKIMVESSLKSKHEDPNYDRFAISWAANLLPKLILSDMVKLSWNPRLLININPLLGDKELQFFQNLVIDWMQLCVFEDRISRAIALIQSEKIAETTRELQIHRKYSVRNHPAWLAFEVDQGIQIRPEQMDIMKQMLENTGSVTQLNMGLGKTRVILPCLFLEWSRRNSCYEKEGRIVSIYLLSSLLNEGFSYFHRVLTGGIFNKKLFLMPFSRDITITNSNSRILVANYKYCQLVGGAVIQSPEHRLSLHLKKFTFAQNGNQSSNEEEIPQILGQIDSLPLVHLYDEVDEIMNPVKQLIYAEGHPELLQGGERRWEAIFALLYNLRHHSLLKDYLETQEFSSRCEVVHQEFDLFQLLPSRALDKAIPKFVALLAYSLFSPATVAASNLSLEFPLDWMKNVNNDLKRKIITCVTDVELPIILEESDLEHIDHYHDILTLRGLLGHGILVHCLSLRYNVNYGVVNGHKTPMAIPFRAANLPALRSEFSQPDCAIGFTIISYYNCGLKREQLYTAFLFLLQLGNNHKKHVYRQVYDLYVLPKTLNILLIKLKKLTWEMKNMALINFWLSYVVFPTHTMIFPQKLMANSWDLTDTKKSIFQCGFSGTLDSCIYLPYPLKIQKAVIPSLAGTDGKMISHIMYNAEYASLADHSSMGESVVDQMIKMAIKEDVDAFIDAGALLCNYSNKDIAFKFLSDLNDCRFKGVVFFCTDNNIWKVIDQRRKLAPLETSAIHESEAFVIYDQSRCRGADMKLKTNAKALLTIGPKMRKEDLMQAAGRLRKLDYGQKLIVTTNLDVEVMLRDTISLSSMSSIEMHHVLLYALFNSIKWVSDGLGYYICQGIQFLKTSENNNWPIHDEFTGLKDIYHARILKHSLKEIAAKSLEQISDSTLQKRNLLTKSVQDNANQFGMDVFRCSSNFEDLVERELEVEREMQQEKEIELPSTSPAKEKDWDYKILLNHSSTDAINAGRSMSIVDFFKKYISESAIQDIRWNSIYLTENFAVPLTGSKKLDHYLRPIRHGLYFPLSQIILLLSDREADGIINLYMLHGLDNDDFPILFGIDYLNDGYDINANSVYSSLITKVKQIPDIIHALLELFSGKTDLSDLAQKHLADTIIETPMAVDGARFFSEKRGFRNLYQGSNLKKTLEEIKSKLFWKRKSTCEKKPTV